MFFKPTLSITFMFSIYDLIFFFIRHSNILFYFSIFVRRSERERGRNVHYAPGGESKIAFMGAFDKNAIAAETLAIYANAVYSNRVNLSESVPVLKLILV